MMSAVVNIGPTPQPLELDYRALFKAMPGLFLLLSPDLRIVEASDAYLRATMTRREEILGRDFFDVFPDNPADSNANSARNLRASIERVLATRAADTAPFQKYDVRRPPCEGNLFEERWWAVVNSPFFGRDGNLTCIVHRVEDVTSFVRMRQRDADFEARRREHDERAQQLEALVVLHAKEVAHSLAEARSATRAREDLLAIASHDLRNLLGSITLGLAQLERILDASIQPNCARQVAIVRRSSQRANDLVNDLLSAAAIEAGIFAIERAPEDLAAIVEEAIATASPLADAACVNTTVAIPSGPIPVLCDRRRILQVLANLLGNAIKFSAGGLVHVTAECAPGGARVSVSDSGPGIAPEDQTRIFDRYWTRRQGRACGTGLGLYIAQGIIEAHGGRICVKSEPGHGSTFTFELVTGDLVT
jgi:signal transduction histidine kinase